MLSTINHLNQPWENLELALVIKIIDYLVKIFGYVQGYPQIMRLLEDFTNYLVFFLRLIVPCICTLDYNLLTHNVFY